MTELTVRVPEDLAKQMRAAGLLDEADLERLFREALRKQAVGELDCRFDCIQRAFCGADISFQQEVI